MNFNHEELMLMMLYNTGTRMGLIHELRLMQCYLMKEKYQYLFLCAKASDDFEAFMKLAG